MAEKQATLLLKIKETGSAALNKIKDGFGAIRSAAVPVAGAIAAVGAAAFKLGLDASKFDEVKSAFNNLAMSQGQDSQKMLANMRQLSAGTVSDMDLMKQANQALLLGLPVDKFGDMLNIARSSAKATGQSMDFMLQSIVTGLGRGSKLMLDNLGIMIDTNKAYEKYAVTLGKTADQLTDAEKKTAFINEALAIGTENAKAAGAGTLSLNDMWEQLKATFQNVAVLMGKALLPTLNFFFQKIKDISGALQENITTTDNFNSIIVFVGKTVIAITNIFNTLGKTIGNVLGGALGAISLALKGEFTEAWGLAKEAAVATVNDVKAGAKSMADNLTQYENAITQTQQENNEKRLEDIAAVNARKQELLAQQRAEEAQAEADFQAQLKSMQAMSDNELAMKSLDSKIKNLNEKIQKEKEYTKQLELEQKRRDLLEQKEDLIKRQRVTAYSQFQAWMEDNDVRNKQDTFSRISSLTQSNNSTLVAIGKAAALANIAISTAEGVARALGAFPPPFNFAAAAAVGAAGAVQAGKIAGIALAEGGIIPGTTGGVPAIIGEGGRDEAVIPLDDEEAGRSLGSTINITINGGLLGDATSARELAIALDEELFKLRQNNESISFDQGLT